MTSFCSMAITLDLTEITLVSIPMMANILLWILQYVVAVVVLNMNCSPTVWCVLILDPQLVVLSGKVIEHLGGGALESFQVGFEVP